LKRAESPYTPGLAARSAIGEREQGDVACALDRNGHGALVLRAGPKLAPRLDLAALADVTAKAGDVLVIDMFDVVGAELADLAPAAETATAATATATATAARAATLAAITLALRTTEAGCGPAIAALAGIRSGIVCRVLSISHCLWSSSAFVM
jgi:hypothetical protein